MKTLDYLILEDGQLKFKREKAKDTYVILKKALDDAHFGVIQVTENLDIWFDDEFLLKNEGNLKPTVVIKNSSADLITYQDVILCGKVLFCSSDEEGETISLTTEGMKDIEKFSRAWIKDKPVLVYKAYEN